jgi:hypothetical protein
MIEYRYRPEPLLGAPPPTLPSTAALRFRPLVPLRVFGSGGRSRLFLKAVVDTGADETVLPWATATQIGAALLPASGHSLRWRGSSFPLRFARVELQLSTARASCRWPATVAITSAPLTYPLLGITGCLEFFDVLFRGEDRIIEFSPTNAFPGVYKQSP